jgi:hypothetical protein
MVNGKKFAYTAKGEKAAKMEAAKTGKPMKKTAKKKTMKKAAPKRRGLFGGM